MYGKFHFEAILQCHIFKLVTQEELSNGLADRSETHFK